MDQVSWSDIFNYSIKTLGVFGGIYGLIQLIDRLMRKPRLSGNVEQYIDGQLCDPQKRPVGLLLMFQMYIVNKSLHPTTIRGWNLQVKIDGKWIQAKQTVIANDFRIPNLPFEIDFSKSLLYEHCTDHYLEYAKGVHGWLRFDILDPSITLEQLKGAPIKLVVTDALGWKHHISDKLRGGAGAMYYPGVGIKPR